MKTSVDPEISKILELTTNLVSAYASNNKVQSQELVVLCNRIFVELTTLSGAAVVGDESRLVPAVAVEDSVTPDYIYCLEDGKPFQSLKRHIGSKYGMTPEQYRDKWGLPEDYPMVAPNYSRKRSELARDMRFGHMRKDRNSSR
ncbi:MucR family transcriptional regulator [Agrobacterium sp. 22-3674b3]|jgi:predicted transcriptional regulator|nr:MucR family transcriptional regulator [Agrobacterium sp.]